MPHVVITAWAQSDMLRCRQFLAAKNPVAAKDAGKRIKQRIRLLETTPDMGAPYDPGFPDVRELTIPFGDSGYVALYRHEPADDAVYVLAFRHQKEAGY
jgi:plasmid stabilization system protein ParE